MPSLHAAHGPVLLADEDADGRASLARALRNEGFDVVEASTGDEALALARAERPCVTVLEVSLSEISGYEICRTVKEEFGDAVSVIFLSGTRTESFDRVAGLMVGADDYVVKPYARDELLARIRRVVRAPARPAGVAFRLTRREREVLSLLAGGSSPREIASQLYITPKTVATHLEHIFRKLAVSTRAQAVGVAYRHGLV